MYVAERQDYHLIDDIWFSYKILKIPNFCLRFSGYHHFQHQSQSDKGVSELNNDADLIFIATVDRLLNMANLFDVHGGPYRNLDFKK